MMRLRSLRFRMMLLFCAVVGVLLAASYAGFYALFARQERAEFDGRLLSAARPVMADLQTDPTENDVDLLNLPGEYFELLDASGRVLQRSKNLRARPLDLAALPPASEQAAFLTLRDSQRGRLRVAAVPFRRGSDNLRLVVAIPTAQADRVLADLRRMILVLMPVSLLLAAAVSSWYVGRSLRPVAELTRHAAEMSRRVSEPAPAPGVSASSPRSLWTPLPVRNPHDELGQLAETFNRLFGRVDAAVGQLRQFVSDASHELRTPLAVLQGETELVLASPRAPERYEEALRVVQDELKKLSRIVESLFTLSMADAGQLRVAREPLYLNEVLEEACALATPRAQAKQISILRRLNEEFAYQGDEAFLRQLFLIFLDNAIKYSPPRTSVQVSLERAEGQIRARFRDQGRGISAEQRPHIFERFYRGAPSEEGPSADGQSGGLGLAIAQAIARAHGGSIECTSVPGQGSNFAVTLPLEPSSAAPLS
jgi:two-component system, OmpR family, sensor kinase